MDPHGNHDMPMPTGGWRSRRSRRRAEKAHSIDLLTTARQRRTQQNSVDRAADRGEDPMSWPLRILAGLVAIVVLAVAAVIAAVTVGAGVGFYDTHLSDKNISFAALGIQTPLNLPTFTPLATEGIVWATTLLAIVMVLLNRTATLWTRSMWAFASIAAFVGAWFGINDEHDLFGGVLRGSLSLAGPYLVHLFILWCRHLRSGKTLTEARIDMEIKWRKAGKWIAAILILVLRHVRHLRIAMRAFGYWTGVDGWSYQTAWRAASVDYRRDIQAALGKAARPPAAVVPAADIDAAETAPPATVVDDDDTLAAGSVMTAERPAVDEAEIDRFIADLDTPPAAWNIWAGRQEQAADGGGRNADEKADGSRAGRGRKTVDAASGGGRKPAARTLRSRLGRRPSKRVAGTSPAADVDIADLLPAARKVAAELGGRLSRDALIDGLRARGVSVGGRRKKAVYDAVRNEQQQGER